MFCLLILIRYLIMTWEGRFEFGFLRVLHRKVVMQGDLVHSWILRLHSSHFSSYSWLPSTQTGAPTHVCGTPAGMPTLYPTSPSPTSELQGI